MTYAIFKAGGYQYRAEIGEVLRLPSLEAESGATVSFDEVLLGATDDDVLVGRPMVEGAVVRAQVLRHGRADKIIVFKFKRRKNYRRKTGHRQNFTEVRVSEIDLAGAGRVTLNAARDKPVPSEKPAAKPEPKAAAAAKTKPAAEAGTVGRAAKPKAAPKRRVAKKAKPAAKTAEKSKPKAAEKSKPKAAAKKTTAAKDKDKKKSKKKS